jgi:hypothetical protein
MLSSVSAFLPAFSIERRLEFVGEEALPSRTGSF